MGASADTTHLLAAMHRGEPGAVDQLFSRLYHELRDLAHRQLARGRLARTLNTTSLVNEAYLKLVEPVGLTVQDRVHFLSLAARVMRQVLVDYARRHRARKRGSGMVHKELNDSFGHIDARAEEFIALDHALKRLGGLDLRLARVVELRFFGGCSTEEIADTLSTSTCTVKRDWRKARAYLQRTLAKAA